MQNRWRVTLGSVVGVVAVLTLSVGSVEGAGLEIGAEVPLASGDFSADGEGYLEIDTHFTRNHVDMDVGPVRLCGSFPFYWPCTDISYWVPKWMSEVAVMTKPQAGSGVPNEAGKGRYFFEARVKAVWTGPTPNASVDDVFLMPCTRNNLCVGVPTPEASPAMLPNYVNFFYDSREDLCWSDESMLQCGDPSGSQCPVGSKNKLEWDTVDESQEELTPQRQPSQASCKMKPLGAFDYWRIAPPFGNWGRALPRSGHVIHSNKIAASGLAALRAFNIARYPVEVWPQEGFLRLPLSHPDVEGPAPIGQPAIFPWVGPFPCTHMMDNNKTGLRGTMAFPSGVDISSIFGGNYCGGHDNADDDGLAAQPQDDPDNPGETTVEDSGCPRTAWKAFEQENRELARQRREMMANDDTVTTKQAHDAHPPLKEMFRWVYWRFRKCTCPWPSPSWAYAEWFRSQDDGWGDNSCIAPGNWAQVPAAVAELAGKTLREAGKAAVQKAKDAAGETLQDIRGVTDGMTEMFGDLNIVGDRLVPSGTNVLPGNDAGDENLALRSDDGKTSSSLTEFTSMSGGHEDTLQASGALSSESTAGQQPLQSQHVASLEGPESNRREIPGVASDSMRPQMRLRVTESWSGPGGVEQTVYQNTDAMSVESSQAENFAPAANRFGNPGSPIGLEPPIAVPAVPLFTECTLGLGSDCNDAEPSDWDSLSLDRTLDFSQAQLPDASLSGTRLTDKPGTGVCDMGRTRTCAQQRCRWRQCASNCTFSWCGEPYCNPPTMEVERCTTSGDPPVETCVMVTVCRPCSP